MKGNESLIPQYIQAAILETFKVQVSSAVTIESTSLVKDGEVGLNVDCLSVLGIKSSEHVGSLTLWFPKATFLAALEKMLGETYPDITAENADACSELLNIIYAAARLNINQQGFDFQPSIPTTVRGKELEVASGAGAKVLRFSCKSDLGPFAVDFSLKKAA